MTSLAPALHVRDFRRWFVATFGMSFALQMLEVIIGWSAYSHRRSALDLGWIGLAEFIPLFVLALPAGRLADRYPRRHVLAAGRAVRDQAADHAARRAPAATGGVHIAVGWARLLPALGGVDRMNDPEPVAPEARGLTTAIDGAN